MKYASVRLSRLASPIVLTCILAACAAQQPAGLTDADRTAIQEGSDSFAENILTANFEGLGALYTEDGVLLPPNAPAQTGRTAIQEFLAGFPPITAFSLTNVNVEGSGDLAYVRGSYQMAMTGPDGGAIEDTGKFIEIRRKVGDAWLMAYDMFSSDLPLPSP